MKLMRSRLQLPESVRWDARAVEHICSELCCPDYPTEDGEVDVGSAVAAFLAGLLTGNGTNFDMLAQQQARAARDVTEGEWGRRRALLRNSMQVQD